MDPMNHFISNQNVLEFGNNTETKNAVVVRKTPLKSRNLPQRKPKRRVCQYVPKLNVGDTSNNFATVIKNERESNLTTSENEESTYSLSIGDDEKKCTNTPEMVRKVKKGFESSDEQNIQEVYYDSCSSTGSNCVEDECEWTDGPKSLGEAVYDNSDSKRTSLLDTYHIEPPVSLQDTIANMERCSLPDQLVDHCSQEDSSSSNRTRQLQVVNIEIPFEIAECAVNIIYSEASKGVLLDRCLRQPVFTVMNLILVEVAKYELLGDDWNILEDFSSSTETRQGKVVKIEIPLEIAKCMVKICYSESLKGDLIDSSLKRPVFLVTDLILDEVAKCEFFDTERCTLENSLDSTKTGQREVVNIEISLETAKCAMNIFQTESSKKVLLDCGLKRPVFLVMDVILNKVTKLFNDERCLLKSSSRLTMTKQRQVVKIKIPLVIAECAVNTFYSELSKWAFFEPDLNRPMFEVMNLIQKEVIKYRLLDDESIDHPKTTTSEENSDTNHRRGCNNLEELYNMAEDCMADLCNILDFIENVDPGIAQGRQKRRLDAQEREECYVSYGSEGSFPTFVANILIVISILAALMFPALRSMYMKYGLSNEDKPFLSYFYSNKSTAVSDAGALELSMMDDV